MQSYCGPMSSASKYPADKYPKSRIEVLVFKKMSVFGLFFKIDIMTD